MWNSAVRGVNFRRAIGGILPNDKLNWAGSEVEDGGVKAGNQQGKGGGEVDCAMEKILLGVEMVLIVRWREFGGMLAQKGGSCASEGRDRPRARFPEREDR